MPRPKVPEPVLEAYEKEMGLPILRGGRSEDALATALAQHHKELLGDKSIEAANAELSAYGHDTEDLFVRDVIQAAIDSVMKGGDGG